MNFSPIAGHISADVSAFAETLERLAALFVLPPSVLRTGFHEARRAERIEQRLNFYRRHDVGHEIVLPERARKDHR